MKRNIFIFSFAALFFLAAFIAWNYFAGDFSRSEAQELLKKIVTERRVTLRFGDKSVTASYKQLGVSFEEESFLLAMQANRRFSMASIFSFHPEKRQIFPTVHLDEKTLKKTILDFFPSLKDPEQTAPQFFVTAENQISTPPVDFTKAIQQLAYEARRLQDFDIVIETVADDRFHLPKTDGGKLIEKTVILKAEGDDVSKIEWQIPLKTPGWVAETPRGEIINEEILRSYLETEIAGRLQRPQEHAYIKGLPTGDKAEHIDVSGVARDGISVSIEDNAEKILAALDEGVFEISLDIEKTPSYIFNESGADFGELTLLATGRSNFAGSPEGRVFNIQKGLSEKMNNILIPPGGDFSFNSFLGPVTNRAGWKNALGIFGAALKPVPGGGLCQVSTTVYRAALAAGLPMTERRSHSLYVKYYKEYGEGLDATIFQGGQDLVFKNDTPSYLLMQSYVDGNDAYVKIYGTPDGRRVAIEGPYRTKGMPQTEIERHNYVPRKNEIAWHRRIEKEDGNVVEEQILSRYRTLPN